MTCYSPAGDRIQGRTHFIALDGLRGAAVLLVILHHGIVVSSGGSRDGLYQLAAFGWVGVDLFFVLSGFLITGILCDTRKERNYFGKFYIRRALRIFPLYYAALLALLICLPLMDLRSGMEFRRYQGWYWAYMVNILSSLHPYAPSVARTGHLWSLAVEEQFYVLWPVVVLLLDLRRLRRVCIAAIVAAPILRAVLLFQLDLDGLWVYTLLPTRIDALMVGALLAIAARDAETMALLERWLGRLATFALVVVGAVAFREHSFMFRNRDVQLFGYSAICILAGALVAALTWSSRTSWLKRTCESRLLRWFGRYSYAGYVIHFPLMFLLLGSWTRILGPTHLTLTGVAGRLSFTLVSLCASSGLAFLSWYVIERPFLRMKRFFV
jgi:peptidoglycan/LPS O-acetylase OafA/YrhL